MKKIALLKDYIKYEKVLDKYELLGYIDEIESEVDIAIQDASDVSDLKWEIEDLEYKIYTLEEENTDLVIKNYDLKELLKSIGRS